MTNPAGFQPPSSPSSPSGRPSALDQIVGADAQLRHLLARVALIAPTRMPVLVTGESGTGKELMALALHQLSPRAAGPLVAVNCGTLSRELAESELFGHEKGSFTGAGGRRLGWFEEASGGTLVLDEIGDLPLDLQPKLLRVLETGRLRRVGGSGETLVDVRVVAMTLRDLREDSRRGTFRLDLYHRLAGFELHLPPLRRRRGDIAGLARHFLNELHAEVVEVGPCEITATAIARLEQHDWPGNVRELRNVIRRAAILGRGHIGVEALELEPSGGCEIRLCERADDAPDAMPASPASDGSDDTISLPGKSFDEIERTVFVWALRRSSGSRRRAAQALGISRSTFCDRVKRFHLGAESATASAPPAHRSRDVV